MEENKIISNCKVVIIGGSAGSLNVLMQILPQFTTIKWFCYCNCSTSEKAQTIRL